MLLSGVIRLSVALVVLGTRATLGPGPGPDIGRTAYLSTIPRRAASAPAWLRVPDAELAQDGRHVVVDGLLGHDEPRGDLGVAQPLGHEREDLELARCQARRVRAGRGPRARGGRRAARARAAAGDAARGRRGRPAAGALEARRCAASSSASARASAASYGQPIAASARRPPPSRRPARAGTAPRHASGRSRRTTPARRRHSAQLADGPGSAGSRPSASARVGLGRDRPRVSPVEPARLGARRRPRAEPLQLAGAARSSSASSSGATRRDRRGAPAGARGP